MSAEAASRKPFPWLAVTIWLFVLVLLGVLGFFGHFWYERRQAESQLEQVIAELDRDDPGWRFEDIEAAREQIPDAENGALVVESAYGKLTRYWPYPLCDTIDQPDPNERLSEDAIKAIGVELQLESAALDEARRLSSFDKGRYKINHLPDPSRTLHPHFNSIPVVVHLLRLDAVHAAAQQDFPRALRACGAMVAAGRTIGDEPMIISLSVRCAKIGIACATIERILGQGVSAPENLLALQRLLEKEDAWNGLVQACRGEKSLFHRQCEALLKCELKPGDLMGHDPPSSPFWMPSREKERFFHARAEALAVCGRFLEGAQEPMPVRGAAMKRVDRDIKMSADRIGVLVIILPYYQKAEEHDRRHHARLRCVAAMLAAERFRLKQHRWPAKIEELKDYTAKETLIDPCDGKPLRLRREADGLVIYSVSVNGIDDGGTEETLKGSERLDEGCRLWDVAKRRQPPVPRPPPLDEEGPPGGPPPQR